MADQPAARPWYEALPNKTVYCAGCKSNVCVGPRTHEKFARCRRCKKVAHKEEYCRPGTDETGNTVPGVRAAHTICVPATSESQQRALPTASAQQSALKRAAMANGEGGGLPPGSGGWLGHNKLALISPLMSFCSGGPRRAAAPPWRLNLGRRHRQAAGDQGHKRNGAAPDMHAVPDGVTYLRLQGALESRCLPVA